MNGPFQEIQSSQLVLTVALTRNSEKKGKRENETLSSPTELETMASIHASAASGHSKTTAMDKNDCYSPLLIDQYKQMAEEGDVHAMMLLASNCDITDPEKAIYWYKMAAKKGYLHAQSNLGSLYMDGRCITPDYEKATKYFQMAIDQHESSHALGNLALMHILGMGIPRSSEKAAELFGRALANKNAHDDYISAFYYGLMHLKGDGVEQNYEIAFKWLEKATSRSEMQGLTSPSVTTPMMGEAYAMVGELYELGTGTDQDVEKALEMYKKAALLGHTKGPSSVERIEATMGKMERTMDSSSSSDSICNKCGCIARDLHKFARCRKVRYCCRECQVADWPIHQKSCKKRARK